MDYSHYRDIQEQSHRDLTLREKVIFSTTLPAIPTGTTFLVNIPFTWKSNSILKDTNAAVRVYLDGYEFTEFDSGKVAQWNGTVIANGGTHSRYGLIGTGRAVGWLKVGPKTTPSVIRAMAAANGPGRLTIHTVATISVVEENA